MSEIMKPFEANIREMINLGNGKTAEASFMLYCPNKPLPPNGREEERVECNGTVFNEVASRRMNADLLVGQPERRVQQEASLNVKMKHCVKCDAVLAHVAGGLLSRGSSTYIVVALTLYSYHQPGETSFYKV